MLLIFRVRQGLDPFMKSMVQRVPDEDSGC